MGNGLFVGMHTLEIDFFSESGKLCIIQLCIVGMHLEITLYTLNRCDYEQCSYMYVRSYMCVSVKKGKISEVGTPVT